MKAWKESLAWFANAMSCRDTTCCNISRRGVVAKHRGY